MPFNWGQQNESIFTFGSTTAYDYNSTNVSAIKTWIADFGTGPAGMGLLSAGFYQLGVSGNSSTRFKKLKETLVFSSAGSAVTCGQCFGQSLDRSLLYCTSSSASPPEIGQTISGITSLASAVITAINSTDTGMSLVLECYASTATTGYDFNSAITLSSCSGTSAYKRIIRAADSSYHYGIPSSAGVLFKMTTDGFFAWTIAATAPYNMIEGLILSGQGERSVANWWGGVNTQADQGNIANCILIDHFNIIGTQECHGIIRTGPVSAGSPYAAVINTVVHNFGSVGRPGSNPAYYSAGIGSTDGYMIAINCIVSKCKWNYAYRNITLGILSAINCISIDAYDPILNGARLFYTSSAPSLTSNYFASGMSAGLYTEYGKIYKPLNCTVSRSYLKNYGTNLSAGMGLVVLPSLDITSADRGSQWDIGAYECYTYSGGIALTSALKLSATQFMEVL